MFWVESVYQHLVGDSVHQALAQHLLLCGSNGGRTAGDNTTCRQETMAHDWAGRPWADEWQPITFLKRQRGDEGDGLYEKARALEAAKYRRERVAVQEENGSERRSPRLVEARARGV